MSPALRRGASPAPERALRRPFTATHVLGLTLNTHGVGDNCPFCIRRLASPALRLVFAGMALQRFLQRHMYAASRFDTHGVKSSFGRNSGARRQETSVRSIFAFRRLTSVALHVIVCLDGMTAISQRHTYAVLYT